jgi:hypothetical protein
VPASHHIDKINKLIITEWKGDADIGRFISAYQNYQRKLRGRPELAGYDEIINLSNIKNLNYGLSDLKNLAKLTSSFDESDGTKAAYIINSTALSVPVKSYIVIRKIMPKSRKRVRVFYDYFDALKWMNNDTNALSKNHDDNHGIQ